MANKNDFTPEEWTKVLVSDTETATLRDISKALGTAS